MGTQNESATLRTLLIYWSRTENRPKYAILPGVGGNKTLRRKESKIVSERF